MKLKLAAVALAALTIVGCGGKDVAAGKITRKHFSPAHTNTYFVPIYTTSCFGSPPICSTNLMAMIPTEDHVPDQWYLWLEDCVPGDVGNKPKCNRGSVKVTENLFDRAEVGMNYDEKLGLG